MILNRCKSPSLFLMTLLAFSLTACVAKEENYQQELVDQAQTNGIPFLITNVNTSSPNSAGGVDLWIDGINTSQKTIKYLDYDVVAYNAVGDAVRGEIKNERSPGVEETGPISPAGKTKSSSWGNVWYNYSIECARISKLKITFMDKTKRTYSGKELTKLLAPNAYKC